MRRAQIPGGRITFHYQPELGSWRLRPACRYKHWLRSAIAMEKHLGNGSLIGIGRIAYHFVSYAQITALHEVLLGDSSPTDIITLDYRDTGDALLVAEIFVCPAFVKASAQALRQPYTEELRRVLAHGILHLLGYRDDRPETRLRMRVAEERWLSLWKAISYVSHETPRI